MRIAAYKKQGAPNRRCDLSLILFTRAAPRTKSKGLPMDIPVYLLYFLHSQCRVQKARGSRSTFHSISYTFYTRSTTYKKQGALDQSIIVLFIHSNHQRMKSKRHLYTYIHHLGIQQNHFHTSVQINNLLFSECKKSFTAGPKCQDYLYHPHH
jgi:hypothetical protein